MKNSVSFLLKTTALKALLIKITAFGATLRACSLPTVTLMAASLLNVDSSDTYMQFVSFFLPSPHEAITAEGANHFWVVMYCQSV